MANTSDTARNTKPLKIRLTPDAYAKLEALAAATGNTMGGWIAEVVQSARVPRKLDRREVRTLLAKARRAAAGEHA